MDIQLEKRLTESPAAQTQQPACREWTRTIFQRGDDEDYTMATKQHLMDRLRIIMAGRAAEEVTSYHKPAGIQTPCLWLRSGSIPECLQDCWRSENWRCPGQILQCMNSMAKGSTVIVELVTL